MIIYGIFHQGSGLGNQLHRYVVTRVLAKDKGYDFGMFYNPDGSGKVEGFKGSFFLEQPPIMGYLTDNLELKTWHEKKLVENGMDVRGYDPEINFIEGDTIIDGEFQDERYFGHRLKEIDEWLKVEPMQLDENLCTIGFRGGEYALYPDLFLTKEYWAEAKVLMLQNNINMKFEVHTDDPELAQKFFPDYKIIHDIGINWRSVRYSKYAIIANSSFYILPRLLQHYSNKNAFTVSPRYWARRNTKVWSMPQNYY